MTCDMLLVAQSELSCPCSVSVCRAQAQLGSYEIGPSFELAGRKERKTAAARRRRGVVARRWRSLPNKRHNVLDEPARQSR